MKLNRDGIQRMINGRGSSVGGGGSSEMEGVTKAWINANYVSIDFFGRLFKAYHPAATLGQPDEEVLPNDLESNITNIKAMFGFWSDQYIAALGQGSGGGGGGASALSDLVDVTLTSPTQGQALVYDGNGHWVNGDVSVDLSSYATKTWVQQQGYVTSSAISDMATQTWVGQQGFITDINATVWGQTLRKNSTVTGNMTGVGDIQCTSGSRIHGNGGDLYLGNSNNAAWVKIQDMCSQSGDSYWKVYANGNATFANVLSNGYVTALSDIRLKEVINRIYLKPEAIAMASIIRYQWKDKHDELTHVGGIAQEWQELLPDAVIEGESGHLSMDYGVISYAAVVSLARTVVNQQQKIDRLEKRLARLEAMFALKDEEED